LLRRSAPRNDDSNWFVKQVTPCLVQRFDLRGLPFVTPAQRLEAAKAVTMGDPRRIPPATQLEWKVRREPLPALMNWQIASAEGR
jgi:hypothetical protein